jgi:signal transduction histidine kinase
MVGGARWVRRGLTLIGIWSIPGLITTSQWYLLYVDKDDSLTLGQAFVWRFLPWQLWALATPLILALRRRLPLTRQRLALSVPLHLLANLALGVADQWLAYQCGRLAGQEPYTQYSAAEMVRPMLMKGAVLEIFLYWGVIVADAALDYQRRYREAALSRAQLEARLVEAHLDTLKMQLHPHFLFNTLNAISVLVRKGDAPGALKMLGGLGDLLRRSLRSIRVEFVALRQELDFLRRYLDIETTRFPDRLRVVVDADDEALDARVPNLILQPLVENALEHGLAPRAEGGQVEIVARAAAPDLLRIEVRDDGLGLRPGAPPTDGVGLAHVRGRLAQLYPGRHRFALEPRAPRGVVAVLEIPLEPEGEPCAP